MFLNTKGLLQRVLNHKKASAAKVLIIYFGVPGIFCNGCSADRQAEKDSLLETFTNPIVDEGADPWVIRWQNHYLYCYSKNEKIRVSRSDRLEEIGDGAGTVVWKPEVGQSYSHDLWAPELHYLDDKWYIYVAADDGQNANHRMYVLESTTQNPQDPFILKGKIATPDDHWAIDGTVLKMSDGQLYFIWSGWEGVVNTCQHLYIAAMDNPWTVNGKRVLISSPQYDWEKVGDPLVNEGPEVLVKDTAIHLIYSASGSWTDDYCLGRLTLIGDDPLEAENWIKHPQPVFQKTDLVFGPGHASFVKSPDGEEDWIIYHAAKYSGAGWDRDVRMQKFSWRIDGTPEFGRPVPAGVALQVPSGYENK